MKSLFDSVGKTFIVRPCPCILSRSMHAARFLSPAAVGSVSMAIQVRRRDSEFHRIQRHLFISVVPLSAGLDCIAPLVTDSAAQVAALCNTRDDWEGCNLQVEEKLISAVTGINNPASPVMFNHNVVRVCRRSSDLEDDCLHVSEDSSRCHLSDAVGGRRTFSLRSRLFRTVVCWRASHAPSPRTSLLRRCAAARFHAPSPKAHMCPPEQPAVRCNDPLHPGHAAPGHCRPPDIAPAWPPPPPSKAHEGSAPWGHMRCRRSWELPRWSSRAAASTRALSRTASHPLQVHSASPVSLQALC